MHRLFNGKQLQGVAERYIPTPPITGLCPDTTHHRSVSRASSVVSSNHLLGMPSEEQSFILKHFDGAVPPQGCMCRSHSRKAAQHITADPEYIPVWKWEQNAQSAVKCMYQECSASSQNEKLITISTDTFKGIIGIKEWDSAVHLCTTHYHTLYKQIKECTGPSH